MVSACDLLGGDGTVQMVKALLASRMATIAASVVSKQPIKLSWASPSQMDAAGRTAIEYAKELRATNGGTVPLSRAAHGRACRVRRV